MALFVTMGPHKPGYLWHTDQNPGIWTWSCTWGWATSHITTGFMGGMLALDAVISTAGDAISAQCCVGALIDNMALISRIQTWHHQGSGGTLHPEYDLLQVAKNMAKHKLVVEPEHIKSHQDHDTEYSNLP